MPYIIQDDVLAPRESIIIDYSGPNPLSAYYALDQLLRLIFEFKGSHLFEPDFRWDITEDPRPFFIRFYAERGFDKFTRVRIDFKLLGKQPTDPTKSGSLRIEIKGFVRTEYKLATIFHKIFILPFIYLYHIAYYNRIRRGYIEWLRRRIERLENELRELLKIPIKPI